MTSAHPPATLFHDVDSFVAHPRLQGLTCSTDGTRLIATVSTPNPDRTAYISALWEVDPQGQRPAHRLTRSAEGEGHPALTVSNDLFFTSKRPSVPSSRGDSDDSVSKDAALWHLPAAGGEARLVDRRPGGIVTVTCAAEADVSVITAPLLPGAQDEQQHAAAHQAREAAGVKAILHQSYPIRFWDHDLTPGEPQFFVLHDGENLRPITLGLDASLREHAPSLSPDGRFVLSTATVFEAAAEQRTVLVRIEVDSGEQSRVIDELDADVESALISPDSSHAIVSMSPKSTPESAPRPALWLVDLQTGARTPVAHSWDRWGTPAAWLPDGSAVLVLADEDGRGPIFTIDVESGEIQALTSDDATYSAVSVAPHGDQTVAFALRSSPAFPAEVVRVDLASGETTPLKGPVERPALPGDLHEVRTEADDGTALRGWLAMPEVGNGPAPLLVFIHGGPLSSHNAWTWRWNPWVLVAQGYAVLLPDPALSTGYGQDFIQRGWGAWGAAPYTDLLALTDAAEAREDVDAARTAALGGSFGGYMANWIAGHTDRFDAIVTHASLWALDGFGPTTDSSFYWQREMTDQMALDNSPHRFVEHIVTPMLVIHGDKDYRVPIGEGLRLWYELLAKSGRPAADDGSTVHRFLYFPDENHWVLKPQHALVWYEVVNAFLSEHVLGTPPLAAPAVLGRVGPQETSTGQAPTT